MLQSIYIIQNLIPKNESLGNVQTPRTRRAHHLPGQAY